MLAHGDLEIDCAGVRSFSRVPTLGLHKNAPQYDEIDGAQTKGMEKHTSLYDSGLGSLGPDSVITSLTQDMQDIHVSGESLQIEEEPPKKMAEEAADCGYESQEFTEAERQNMAIAQQIYTPDEDGDT